jgi:hypothetical protein
VPGPLLHVGAIINCFHGGPVTPNVTNPPRVLVNGTQQVLTIKELHTVAGCLFTVPGPKPQPCVLVRVVPAGRVLINGQPAAILTPAALCLSAEQLPQGIPNSAPTQKRVIAT